MSSEKRRGLSPEKFVSRVQDSERLAQNWPFGHMPEEKRYQFQYSPQQISVYAPDNTRTLAIGRVHLRSGNEVALQVKSDNSYKLDLQMEDEESATAWEQMVGVNVALQVELGSDKNLHYPSRQARVTRVLGIEQPLYTTNGQGEYPNIAGSAEKGFIQGIVLENTKPSDSYETTIKPGRGSGEATVYLNYAQLLTSRDYLEDQRPLAGDEIRARVRRQFDTPNSFQQTETTVYLLHQNGK